jgi:hypothetical protein
VAASASAGPRHSASAARSVLPGLPRVATQLLPPGRGEGLEADGVHGVGVEREPDHQGAQPWPTTSTGSPKPTRTSSGPTGDGRRRMGDH